VISELYLLIIIIIIIIIITTTTTTICSEKPHDIISCLLYTFLID